VLVNRYSSITDPAQRAVVEKQILEAFFKLQDFTSKFKKSFLDRINRNGRYFFKLLSNMKLEELVRRWPNPGMVISNLKKQIDTNIKMFRQQEHDEIQKSYGLRGYARDIKDKFYTNMDSTVRSINKKAQLGIIEFKFAMIGITLGIILTLAVVYMANNGILIPFKLGFVCS